MLNIIAAYEHRDLENLHNLKKDMLVILAREYPSAGLEFIFDDLAHRQNFDRELEAAQKVAPYLELGELCPRKKRL